MFCFSLWLKRESIGWLKSLKKKDNSREKGYWQPNKEIISSEPTYLQILLFWIQSKMRYTHLILYHLFFFYFRCISRSFCAAQSSLSLSRPALILFPRQWIVGICEISHVLSAVPLRPERASSEEGLPMISYCYRVTPLGFLISI
jgi:hypothetical protein